MSLTVAIAGATGYAGGEILRLLLNHPAYLAGDLEIGALTGHSSAGQTGWDAFPHLPQLGERIIEATDLNRLAEHDIVFLALPHGHSAEIGAALPETTLVLDCAADFRLRDAAAWETYYGTPYAGSWPYGIPELPGHREAIANSKRVALAGCFPTGATLAIWPALAAGLIAPEVAITSVTGVSGAGKKASVALLGAETMGSLKAYNVAGAHRHTPELVQNLSEVANAEVAVSFTPVLAPLSRGILTTATARLAPGVDQAAVDAAYQAAYAAEPFVVVLPEGRQPQTQNVVGSNACHVQVVVDKLSGRLVMTSAIDNLTKGTAGGGVQCMNLALGWPETAGLPLTAVAP